jgi:hypothetical protein
LDQSDYRPRISHGKELEDTNSDSKNAFGSWTLCGVRSNPTLIKMVTWLIFASCNAGLEMHLLKDFGLDWTVPSPKREDTPSLFKAALRQSTAHVWSWIQGNKKDDLVTESERSSVDLSVLERWDEAQITIEEAIHELCRIPISVSPLVSYPPPYLLLKLKSLEEKQQSLSTYYDDTYAEDSGFYRLSWFFSLLSTKHESPVIPSIQPTTLSADSRAGLKYILTDQNTLNIMLKHQRIAFTYSLHILNEPSLISCIFPETKIIDFYEMDPTKSNHDIPLGQYIKDIHRSANDKCPDANCNKTMIEHIRSYSHNTYSISVVVTQDLNYHSTMDQIYTWTQCKICQNCSTLSALSDEAWHYSFGKFLELLFYRDTFLPLDLCEHRQRGDSVFTRLFRYQQTKIKCEKTDIDLYEIKIPRVHLQHDEESEAEVCGSHHLESDIQELCVEVSQFYGRLKGYIGQMELILNLQPEDKVSMMLKDMRAVFDEEHMHLLYTVRNTRFYNLNAMRQKFVLGLQRDLLAFERWQREYAPQFKYDEPPWTFPDYYHAEVTEEKTVHLFPDHGVVVRVAEPTSIIAFTLL